MRGAFILGGRLVLAWLVWAGINEVSWAELRCPRPVVNLGQIPGGRPVAQHFQVLNSGKEPITLLEVKTTCNCLVSRLEPRELSPNQEGRIEITVRTLGQPAGPHTWLASVHYRQGDRKAEMPLALQAILKPEVAVQPAILALHVTGAMTKEVTLTDYRGESLRIAQVGTSSGSLKARLDREERNPQGHWIGTIRVDVPAEIVEGRHEEILTIFTSDPAYREIKVPVTIVKTKTGGVTVSPPELRWNISPGQPVPPKLVRVRANGEGSVTVEEVKADHPAIRCRWANGTDGTATVRVEVEDRHLATTEVQTKIMVRVRGTTSEEIQIPLQIHRDQP